MIQDTGVYILVCPSVTEKGKEEFRVAYLEASNNITWTLDHTSSFNNIIDPTKVASKFIKSEVLTDKLDAEEVAHDITDDLNITTPPIYYIYIDTPFIEWSKTIYV